MENPNPYNPPETVTQKRTRWLERPLSVGAKLFLVGIGMFLMIGAMVLSLIYVTATEMFMSP